MTEMDDLLAHAEERLRADLHIEMGIRPLWDRVNPEAEWDGFAARATDILAERRRALALAEQQLEALDVRVQRLASVRVVLPGEWPVRQSILAKAFEEDPARGVAEWLDDWATAVALMRPEAMVRLMDVLVNRPEFGLLSDRAETVLGAVAENALDVVVRNVEPLITDGFELRGRRCPNDLARARTAALVARNILLDAEDGDGDFNDPHLDALFDQAVEGGLRETAAGLDARRLRLSEGVDAAEKRLNRYRFRESLDLDVANELIEIARARQDAVGAQAAATIAVAGVPLIEEVAPQIESILFEDSAELWIAAAGRARVERRADLFREMIEAAEESAVGDWAVAARALELHISAADLLELPSDEQVRLLTEAGMNHLWAGSFDSAIPLLEAALELAPDDVGASLTLADALMITAGRLPMRDARLQLSRSLSLIARADARDGREGENGWAYATESYARQYLMYDVDKAADAQAWPALLASCRALAVNGATAARWRLLADCLTSMIAHDLAREVAAFAAEVFPEDPESRPAYASKLANDGMSAEALAVLDATEAAGAQHDAEREAALRGSFLLRSGSPDEAARLLGATRLDPERNWDLETRMWALILTDRFEDATSIADVIEDHWADRAGDRSALVSLAWADLVRGQFSQAEARCRDAADRNDETGLIHASVRMLLGDAEGGRAALESWLTGSAPRWSLADWSQITAPVLRAVAARYGRDLAELDGLDAIACERLEGSGGSHSDVSATVGRFRVEDGGAEAAEATRMLAYIVQIVRGDPDPAVPGDDVWMQRLRDAMAPFTASAPLLASDEAPEDDADPDISRFIALLIEDRAAEAIATLKEALQARDPVELAALLSLAAADAYEDFDAITDLITGALDVAADARALELVRSLRLSTRLRLNLPPSWFDGAEDPLHEHVIFTESIPEARMRTAGMPGIQVEVHEDLEPDRYQTLVGATVFEERAVPLGARFATRGSLPLLGLQIDPPEDDIVPGIVAVPDDLPPVGKFLTISAGEFVVRRAIAAHEAWLNAIDEAYGSDWEPGEQSTED